MFAIFFSLMVALYDCIRYGPALDNYGLVIGLSASSGGVKLEILCFKIGDEKAHDQQPLVLDWRVPFLTLDRRKRYILNVGCLVEAILVLDVKFFVDVVTPFYEGMDGVFATRNVIDVDGNVTGMDEECGGIFKCDFYMDRKNFKMSALLENAQCEALQWFRFRLSWKKSMHDDLRCRRHGNGGICTLASVTCEKKNAERVFGLILKSNKNFNLYFGDCRKTDASLISNDKPGTRVVPNVLLKVIGAGRIPAMVFMLGLDWSWASRCGLNSFHFTGFEYGRKVDSNLSIMSGRRRYQLCVRCILHHLEYWKILVQWVVVNHSR